ncbi:MAG: acylneuraminate cytidylyltransferase family protein [Muribaculaceae bacterium]|nr:acylneuraminate cytidylyltransferase family protein [Muribaculaceae bacterium]
MKQKSLYIIPARGGSKGIPGKNIKPLHGKPLICYSIDVARSLAPDSHIILSTDDPGIADVARGYGLPVDYMRPAELATDRSGSREVMLDAMDWADSRGIEYERVVLLQPTSPLRTVEDVRRCEERYSPEIDMVVSVMPARCNPYYNCFETDPQTGMLRISKGDGTLTRRQDAPEAWEYNGAVYVINPDSLRSLPMGGFRRRVPVEMPAERSLDLDTPLDWTLMELLMDSSENEN